MTRRWGADVVPAACAMMLVGGWWCPTVRAAPRHDAAAGPTAASGGSAPQCGHEPAPPQVDTATVQRYNVSVDQVTAYDRAARSYDACVSQQATAEQTRISSDARARIAAIQAASSEVQKRIAANFASLGDALRRGVPKPGAR